MKIQTLLAALALTLSGAAFAQTPAPVVVKDPTATPKIDQRQVNQEKRIEQGVATGALIPKETANLQKREAKIAKHKAVAKSDGKVTRAERSKLKREQNRASAAIKRKKHNRQVVAPAAAK